MPAWLNDPIYYHNRGDSTFAGESSEYGDFFGLDDLFTEHPDVVDGMTDIYKAWVDFGIDGFRIDTVKHVNIEFWQKFARGDRGAGRSRGNDDFFAFGEVFDAQPGVHVALHDRGRPAGDARLRLPGAAPAVRQGPPDRRSCATCSPTTTTTPTPTRTPTRCRRSSATTTWAGSGMFLTAAAPTATSCSRATTSRTR